MSFKSGVGKGGRTEKERTKEALEKRLAFMTAIAASGILERHAALLQKLSDNDQHSLKEPEKVVPPKSSSLPARLGNQSQRPTNSAMTGTDSLQPMPYHRQLQQVQQQHNHHQGVKRVTSQSAGSTTSTSSAACTIL